MSNRSPGKEGFSPASPLVLQPWKQTTANNAAASGTQFLVNTSLTIDLFERNSDFALRPWTSQSSNAA
jgi:hypothetical protein